MVDWAGSGGAAIATNLIGDTSNEPRADTRDIKGGLPSFSDVATTLPATRPEAAATNVSYSNQNTGGSGLVVPDTGDTDWKSYEESHNRPSYLVQGDYELNSVAGDYFRNELAAGPYSGERVATYQDIRYPNDPTRLSKFTEAEQAGQQRLEDTALLADGAFDQVKDDINNLETDYDRYGIDDLSDPNAIPDYDQMMGFQAEDMDGAAILGDGLGQYNGQTEEYLTGATNSQYDPNHIGDLAGPGMGEYSGKSEGYLTGEGVGDYDTGGIRGLPGTKYDDLVSPDQDFILGEGRNEYDTDQIMEQASGKYGEMKPVNHQYVTGDGRELYDTSHIAGSVGEQYADQAAPEEGYIEGPGRDEVGSEEFNMETAQPYIDEYVDALDPAIQQQQIELRKNLNQQRGQAGNAFGGARSTLADMSAIGQSQMLQAQMIADATTRGIDFAAAQAEANRQGDFSAAQINNAQANAETQNRIDKVKLDYEAGRMNRDQYNARVDQIQTAEKLEQDAEAMNNAQYNNEADQRVDALRLDMEAGKINRDQYNTQVAAVQQAESLRQEGNKENNRQYNTEMDRRTTKIELDLETGKINRAQYNTQIANTLEAERLVQAAAKMNRNQYNEETSARLQAADRKLAEGELNARQYNEEVNATLKAEGLIQDVKKLNLDQYSAEARVRLEAAQQKLNEGQMNAEQYNAEVQQAIQIEKMRQTQANTQFGQNMDALGVMRETNNANLANELAINAGELSAFETRTAAELRRIEAARGMPAQEIGLNTTVAGNQIIAGSAQREKDEASLAMAEEDYYKERERTEQLINWRSGINRDAEYNPKSTALTQSHNATDTGNVYAGLTAALGSAATAGM